MVCYESGCVLVTSRDAQRKARYSDRACPSVCLLPRVGVAQRGSVVVRVRIFTSRGRSTAR